MRVLLVHVTTVRRHGIFLLGSAEYEYMGVTRAHLSFLSSLLSKIFVKSLASDRMEVGTYLLLGFWRALGLDEAILSGFLSSYRILHSALTKI